MLRRRCCIGRKVACSRSSEIAARFITEINWNSKVTEMTEWYLHLSHDIFFPAIYTGPETPPTNRSTIAKWMIKYVLRRCSWRCFTNTIMVMILRMTIARHSMMSTKSHGIHSDAAGASELSSLLLMLVLLRVLVAMKFHSEGKTML